MKRQKDKPGFTLIEIVIVLSLLAILISVLLPSLVDTYDAKKNEIVDIYNGQKTIMIDKTTGEEIYDVDGYILDSVDYKDGVVYSYYIKKN